MNDLVTPSPQTTPNPTPTPAPAPLPNSPEARSPDGTLLTNPQKAGEQVTAPSTTDPAAPAGAPEAYTDFTAPEGFVLDKDLVGKATPMFKDLGLSQTQAQALINFYADQTIAQAKALETAVTDMRKQWTDTVAADPDLGPKLPQIKQDIGRALSGIADTKLRDDFAFAMDLTGAGDNPAFIKVFHRLAQRAMEGTHVPGGGPSPEGQTQPGSAKPSAAKAMFPNLR